MAAAISFLGTYSKDDRTGLFHITAATSELITIRTFSYATGGLAATAFQSPVPEPGGLAWLLGGSLVSIHGNLMEEV